MRSSLKNIPFHVPSITKQDRKAVDLALRNQWLTAGPITHQFEQKFSKQINAKYCVAVNSCTSALHISLKCLNLKSSDEVIVPAMTFASTAFAVLYAGATLVLGDCDEDTLCMNAESIKKKITKKTKAVIVVHYGGQPCDLDEILKLSRKHKFTVIEDCAHAFNSKYKNKYIGSNSLLSCFSFYATKIITTAEGGMIVTNNKKIHDLAKKISYLGIDRIAWKRKSQKKSWSYDVQTFGYKYNLSDTLAALGLSQLKRIQKEQKKREIISKIYFDSLKGFELIRPLRRDKNTTQHSWHLFVVKIKLEKLKIDRDQILEELKKRGISASVHFRPIHMHTFFKESFKMKRNDLMISSRVYKEIISLPVYSHLSKDDAKRVITELKKIVLKHAKKNF